MAARHHPGSQSLTPRQQQEVARRLAIKGVSRATQVGPYIVQPRGDLSEQEFSEWYSDGPQRHQEGDGSDRFLGGAEPEHGRFVLSALPAVNKIYRCAGFAPIAVAGALGLQSVGNLISHTWAQSGLVCWISGTTLATGANASGTAAGRANVGIAIHVANTDEDLLVNGQLGTPDYTSFEVLFGGGAKFPLARMVVEGEVWTIQCVNRDTGTIWLPEVSFGFMRDPRHMHRLSSR